MVTGPELPTGTKVALIDGMNVVLSRPGYVRGAFEDLLACMDFFRKRSVTPMVVLDRRIESEDFFYHLSAPQQEEVMLVARGRADLVILESALRIERSVIVSDDQFGEYQTRYALVLFDPNRVMTFEWRNGLGSGSLRFGSVRERQVNQAFVGDDILREFDSLFELHVRVGSFHGAEELCATTLNELSAAKHRDALVEARLMVMLAYARAYQGLSTNLLTLLKLWRMVGRLSHERRLAGTGVAVGDILGRIGRDGIRVAPVSWLQRTALRRIVERLFEEEPGLETNSEEARHE